MIRPVFHLCVILIALSSVIRTTVTAGGAELRSTRGERVIVRQVSTASESPDAISATEFLDESMIEPFSPGELNLAADTYVYQPGSVEAYGLYHPRLCDGLWVDAEFLLWWRKGRRFPPLVTGERDTAAAFAAGREPGELPDAMILFGNEQLDEHARPGGRLEFGLWIDPSQNLGLGGHFVALGESPVRYSIDDSSDFEAISRPYRDVSVAPPDQSVLSVYDKTLLLSPTAGQLDLRTGSEVLAADAFFRWLLARDGRTRVDLLFGYQFGRINEDLVIDSFTQTLPVPPGWPSRAVSDLFKTTNEYHGGHFGLQGEYRFGRWSLELLAKFAFGNMRQTVFISGSSVFVDIIGGEAPRTRGMLAQPTNGGEHTQDEFVFMEDIGIKLAYYPVERLKLSVGYSLMYWSSVVRPGEHIDLNIDKGWLTAFPPAAATGPAFSFDTSGFYVHGMNLGAEFRF